MSIVFGICCWISEYNQLKELKRCLDSVKDYRVILVNGKWYDIVADSPLSIPETIPLIEKYPNVERIDYPNHHEWECRNKYLEACTKNDILIVLDTDDYAVISDPNFANTLSDSPTFMVSGYDSARGGDVVDIKGFRYPSETRHMDRHNEVWYNNKIARFQDGKPPKGIKIYHDKSYRSPAIQKIMKTRATLREYR